MHDSSAPPFVAADRLKAGLGLSVLILACFGCALVAARTNGPSAATMAAVFITSIMSSIVGFSFAPVGGAAVTHLTKNPAEVVYVLTLCGVANQSLMTWQMRHELSWRALRVVLAGGLVGLPFGILLWVHTGCRIKENGLALVFIGLGVILPALRHFIPRIRHAGLDFVSGVLGGVTGGAMEFPGAPVAIWCNLKDRDKNRQRGVFQPFMLIILLAAITLMNMEPCDAGARLHLHPAGLLCIPAGLLGTSIGMMLFRRMSDNQFSIAVSLQLIMSGLGYMLI